MFDILGFDFMRNALIAGALVSVACGVIGTMVVLKRIVFLSAGIAHAAYGGIGLGFFLRINPVLGAIVFSLLAALGMGTVQRRTGQRADTLIGVMWAIGMAIGVVLIDLTPGYKADLMGYLFGSILAVSDADLLILLALDIIIVALSWLFHKELLATSFDEDFATIQNVPAGAIHLALMCMIALTVVMMMRIVGLILLIALLTMPAAIGAMFLRDIRRIMLAAGLLGVLFTVGGLWLSCALDLTSGATIILVSAAAFLIGLAVKHAQNVRLARDGRAPGA
jgi:zinc transport system permease protein